MSVCVDTPCLSNPSSQVFQTLEMKLRELVQTNLAKRRIESRRNINHETSRWRAKIILHCCFFLRDSDSRWSYYCLITSRISISSDLRFWEHDLNRVKVAHTIFWQTCLQKTKQTKQHRHTSIAVEFQESDTSSEVNKESENSLFSETRIIWGNSKSIFA